MNSCSGGWDEKGKERYNTGNFGIVSWGGAPYEQEFLGG